MKYTVILEKGRESGCVASVSALRGCVSQRENRQEAIVHIKEAIEVYLQALVEDRLPVPIEVATEMLEVKIGTELRIRSI
jgi:predicted RNase H-like HicB family nuclease